jgi:hypothetical protein
MRKNIVFGILALFLILIVSLPFAAAIPLTYTDNKGIVAKWDIDNNTMAGNTVVYAVLSQTNNGNDGTLTIKFVHTLGTTVRTATSKTAVDFKWNMAEHITVTVTGWSFDWGTGTQPHDIVFTFDALPKSQGLAPSDGISVDGSWKAGNAGLIIDGNTGRHTNDGIIGLPFTTSQAYIFHGDLTVG